MTKNIASIPELDKSIFFFMGQAYKQFRTIANQSLTSKCEITLEMLVAIRALDYLGDIPQQQLATALNRERSATKRLVDNCIKRGLMEPKKSLTNKKTRLISLTEKGYNVKEKANSILTPIIDDFTSPLNTEERATLLKLSKKLVKTNIVLGAD